MPETSSRRQGEYALRGDYHREPADDWDYWPTYVAKMRWVRALLDRLPPGTRVLDVGCGEGVLVEEYAPRLAIQGVDLNYSSALVRQGSVLSIPFADASFDRVTCLDVLEHITHEEQPRAIAEIRRVLAPGGEAILSLPNLAHLQSRVHFATSGHLMRTANERKHPGDRPIGEYLALLRAGDFTVIEQRGVFPTVPVLTHLIRRHPKRLVWLHASLTRLLPFPGWCFLNLVRAVPASRPTHGIADAARPAAPPESRAPRS